MKAFWWFRKGAIAGMARPGFNLVHWVDLPFDEALLLGWLGRYSSGSEPMSSFRSHLHSYGPQIYQFHDQDHVSGPQIIASLEKPSILQKVGERLLARTRSYESFSVDNDRIHFSLNIERLNSEIRYLKEQGIGTVVSLTENHHARDILNDHFETHHFAINDLGAPKIEQVVQLAKVIGTMARGQRLAVHCLAGIGRTSTMLIASHLALGEKFDDLKHRIAKQNPAFALTQEQSDFIDGVWKDPSICAPGTPRRASQP